VTTFAIQANYKWGPDRKEHMLNIQGDDSIEFEMNLAWVRDNIQEIVSLGDLIVGGAVVTAVTSPQGTTTVTATAPSSDTSVAIESDKWGKKFAYGHPDAPDLPDGRGKYILKYVTLKDGTEKKVWVDPAEGPRPCKPGSAKAKQIWVNE
jgi:hypothetical protein